MKAVLYTIVCEKNVNLIPRIHNSEEKDTKQKYPLAKFVHLSASLGNAEIDIPKDYIETILDFS